MTKAASLKAISGALTLPRDWHQVKPLQFGMIRFCLVRLLGKRIVATMKQKTRAFARLGEFATAKSLETSYSLPKGLPEDSVVKLVAFDHGYYTVEFQGQQFQVFMACIRYGD